MAEPISATALTAAAMAAQGAGSFFGANAQANAEKKKAREMKRKTFADLLNDAMNRSHATAQDIRHSQTELSGARAKALQDLAAGIRQSLVR